MNKLLAVKFLNSLLETYPSEGAPMLIDIIVDYLLFPSGDESSFAGMSEVDKKIAELMPDNKIQAIKETRQILGCGLKEAKDYVEQRIWPLVWGLGRNPWNYNRSMSGVFWKKLHSTTIYH